MGLQDTSGASIPQQGSFDVGAYEFPSASADPAAARLFGITPQQDAFQIRFFGTAGRSYTVQASRDLKLWDTVGRADEVGHGTFVRLDPHFDSARFYRVSTRGLPGL